MLAWSLAGFEANGYGVEARNECRHLRGRLFDYGMATPVLWQSILNECWGGGNSVGSNINGGPDLDLHFVDRARLLSMNR